MRVGTQHNTVLTYLPLLCALLVHHILTLAHHLIHHVKHVAIHVFLYLIINSWMEETIQRVSQSA